MNIHVQFNQVRKTPICVTAHIHNTHTPRVALRTPM